MDLLSKISYEALYLFAAITATAMLGVAVAIFSVCALWLFNNPLWILTSIPVGAIYIFMRRHKLFDD